jgi:hypothetical protein
MEQERWSGCRLANMRRNTASTSRIATSDRAAS